MKEKSNNDPFVGSVFLSIWVVIVSVFVGFVLGAMCLDIQVRDTLSSLVDGDVRRIRCHPVGCSLLVERGDGSTDWVWVPPIEPHKEKK
jgi:hypothetical protein